MENATPTAAGPARLARWMQRLHAPAMPPVTSSIFLKKLRYWTPFVCINAAPSFVDLMAGFIAGQIVELDSPNPHHRGLRRSITGSDPALRAKSEWIGDMNSLIPTMLITITEGILLSLALAVGKWLTTKAWQWGWCLR